MPRKSNKDSEDKNVKKTTKGKKESSAGRNPIKDLGDSDSVNSFIVSQGINIGNKEDTAPAVQSQSKAPTQSTPPVQAQATLQTEQPIQPVKLPEENTPAKTLETEEVKKGRPKVDRETKNRAVHVLMYPSIYNKIDSYYKEHGFQSFNDLLNRICAEYFERIGY